MNPKRGPSAEHLLTITVALLSTFILLLAGCAPLTSASMMMAAPQENTAPAASTQEKPVAPPAPSKVEGPQVEPAQASREDYVARRNVEVPLDPQKLGGKKAELWVTADAGQNWTNQGESEPGREKAGFLAPRDGRYGFIVVPLGADGRRETTPKSGDKPDRSVVVDTAAPVVEVLAPNGGEMFGSGRSTVIRWAVEDANLAPAGIRIEASEGGDVWIALAKDLPNSGQYHWDIGQAASARFRIRVVARDLAGNTGQDASDSDFMVDGLAPDLKLVGPAAANEVPVRIEWTGTDVGGSGLKRVSLYVTRDQGVTWKHFGDDEDLQSPFLFTDLDGVLGLRLVAEDKMGNAHPVPNPGTGAQMTLTLDRTKPELKLLSPKAGGYHAGVPVDVQWSAVDNLDMPANGITLSYSADAGKTWKEIARGVKNDGLYKWTPPKEHGTDYRFKIAAADFAGNVREVLSERFGIDDAVPSAKAISPDGSSSNTVQINYEIMDKGSAPIKRVTLYYRPEGMREWLKYGDDPDAASPMSFAKADGKYGIFVTCATESGLKSDFVQKAPEEGVDPQFTLRIDATPPQIHLETFSGGGYVMAGAVSDILWKMVEPNPDLRGLNVYHSPDGGGTWNVVAANIDPTKGSHRWTVPPSLGSRHRIKLVVSDAFGSKATAESERPFTIDSELPTVALVEAAPAVVRSTQVALKYKASDLTSGIDRVMLYGRKTGGKEPYKLLAETKKAEGTMEVSVPSEGAWGMLLIAADAAGHLSGDFEKNPKPDFFMGFDKGKPEIRIKSAQTPGGKKAFVNSSWEVEWLATDAYSPPEKIAVRIEYSSDNGKTWFPAVARDQNTGRRDMRPFFHTGKHYRVRLTAIDEAGNEAEETTEDFDPGDVPLPSLALRGIDEGRRYVAGTSVMVLWVSSDKVIREASLELSRDGAKTWVHLATMHTPTLRVTMPEKEGRYHLRVRATDSVQRLLYSNAVMFETLSGVEKVQVITNSTVAASQLLRVLIEPKGIFATAKEVRLEVFDGKEWKKIGDATKPDLSVPAPGVAGDYVLRAVVTTAEGKEYTSNEPHFKVTERAAASALVLDSFSGGRTYAGGTGQVLTVKTTLEPRDLVVHFSESGGREGSWRVLGPEELTLVEGKFFWKLPLITSATCRLRVSHAQEKLSAESSKDFGIDSQVPHAFVKGPVEESLIPVRLETRVEKTLSPVKHYLLYVSKNEGRTWAPHKTYDAKDPILFAPGEAGDYGVFLTAKSEAGWEGKAPEPGTIPQVVIKARGAGGAAPGVVPSATAWPREFVVSLGPVVKGGTTVEIRWAVGDPGTKIKVSALIDGKAEPIAQDQPASGSARWSVPRMDVKECRLVLEGGKERIVSPAFEIDSTPARLEGGEIEIPGK